MPPRLEEDESDEDGVCRRERRDEDAEGAGAGIDDAVDGVEPSARISALDDDDDGRRDGSGAVKREPYVCEVEVDGIDTIELEVFVLASSTD